MIVIHIDSEKDTAFLSKCYEGIGDSIILYNPSKAEVNKTLTDNPNATVMMMGHGGGGGLFSKDWRGCVIDYTNAHLLKDRECIGIWCYAKNFARNYGLKGYFTSMFISNGGEAKSFGYKDVTEEDVFNEVAIFAERVNALIKAETPLTEWVNALQEQADYSKPYVEFNYSNMEYFDGTQKPLSNYPTYGRGYYYGYDEDDADIYGYGKGKGVTDTKGKGKATYPSLYGTDTDIDNEIDLWFEDYCIVNGIEGEWAKNIAYDLFKAGWDARKDAEECF